jgi:hypothetical protein
MMFIEGGLLNDDIRPELLRHVEQRHENVAGHFKNAARRIGGGEGVCEYISEQRKGWRGEELGQRDEGVNSKRTKKVKDI